MRNVERDEPIASGLAMGSGPLVVRREALFSGGDTIDVTATRRAAGEASRSRQDVFLESNHWVCGPGQARITVTLHQMHRRVHGLIWSRKIGQ